MSRLDEETEQRFNKTFNNIYANFAHLSYGRGEIFIEYLKRTLKKDRNK